VAKVVEDAETDEDEMIRRLRLQNFQCFKGIHEIQLGAKVYAIAARDAANPERSNWLGKSTLLESIRFVLYGSHRHRTEDAWISNDASEGSVELELDSGLVITRSRKRGKRTEIKVEGAIQKEADLAIARVMGMNEQDFLATSYFEQRQMARFVLARPADRMETVRAWTQLDKLENAYADTMRTISEMRTRVAQRQAERAVYEQRAQELPVFDEKANFADLIAVRAELDKIREKRAALREQENKYARRVDLQFIVDQGKDLAVRVKGGADLSGEISKYEQEKGAIFAKFLEVNQEYNRLSGARPFDGKCPILRDTCPVAKEVGARCASDVELRKKVATEHTEAENAKREISDKLSKLSIHQQDWESAKAKLEGLRAKRDAMLAEGVSLTMEKPESGAALYDIQRVLEAKEEDIKSAKFIYDRAVKTAQEDAAKMKEIDGVLETLRGRLEILQATAQIFGRNGAQKVAAKGILEEIQNGANDSLADCGVDLSVELTWGEEGEGLAKECGTCGAPFPTSAKVKACGTCGAVRGANMMQRLDVRLSDRSGAAEDMAGMAIQLAASGWLRRTRGATWDTALIDEPFSALDTANRKAMTKHFSTLLSGSYGFRQAIVVAHNADVTYSMPGRIEIEWANGCPRLKVVE
jgi:DNA repair exonuclease SbcCD ATPase subunit